MAVKVLEEFNIDIYKLPNGVHNYLFEVDDSFFEAFDNSIVNKGKGKVEVTLDKTETLIKLTFNINVAVELECDRSLDLFDYPVNSTKDLLIKYGDHEEEINEELIMIPREKQRINLAQYLYEFIGLSIPMKKLHPRYGDDSNNDELIYTSEDQDQQGAEGDIDPRWQKLKKLK